MARRRCKVRRDNSMDSAPLMSSTEPPSGKRATARIITSISFCETFLGIVSSLWRNTAYRATTGYLCGAIFIIGPLKVTHKCYFAFLHLDHPRVNPVYCCAREDQPKRHAFAPRLKARR